MRRIVEAVMAEQAKKRAPRRRPVGCLTAILVALLLVTLAGLSITGHDVRLLWYRAQTVDTLHVTYTALSGQSYLPRPAQDVTNAAAVQDLYDAAFALPADNVIQDIFDHENCALGGLVDYHLAFARGATAIATIDLDLEGCGSVSLAGVATWRPTWQFEHGLATMLHMTDNQFFAPEAADSSASALQMMLTVTREGETPMTHVQPLYATITDAREADALGNAFVADATYGGTQQTPPASDCPPNDGVLYHLSFYQDGANVAVKDVEATGCQLIFTHDGFPPEHISDPAFWRLLADTLHVPLSSLGVGPVAPYWTTAPTPMTPAR